jgi:hypothetical protein
LHLPKNTQDWAAVQTGKKQWSLTFFETRKETDIGLEMLPDEIILSLTNQWPCRDLQIKTLSALLSV